MLFIGNSFTQRNNLPVLIAEMATARDLRVKHELISGGGASLRTHWNAGNVGHGPLAVKWRMMGKRHYAIHRKSKCRASRATDDGKSSAPENVH
jgi:hypothetical protein